MRMAVLLCSKTIAQLCVLFSTSDNYIVCKTTAIMQNGDFTFTKIIWKYMIETPKTTLPCHVTAIYLLLDLQMTHFQLGRTQSENDANSHICNVLYHRRQWWCWVGFPIHSCFSVEFALELKVQWKVEINGGETAEGSSLISVREMICHGFFAFVGLFFFFPRQLSG